MPYLDYKKSAFPSGEVDRRHFIRGHFTYSFKNNLRLYNEIKYSVSNILNHIGNIIRIGLNLFLIIYMLNIPFHKPMVPENFNDILSKSIKDGWLTTGSEVKNFESMSFHTLIMLNIQLL